MILNKPLRNYSYKLTVVDSESGKEKTFLPIQIKDFNVRYGVIDLDRDIKEFIYQNICPRKLTTGGWTWISMMWLLHKLKQIGQLHYLYY